MTLKRVKSRMLLVSEEFKLSPHVSCLQLNGSYVCPESLAVMFNFTSLLSSTVLLIVLEYHYITYLYVRDVTLIMLIIVLWSSVLNPSKLDIVLATQKNASTQAIGANQDGV